MKKLFTLLLISTLTISYSFKTAETEVKWLDFNQGYELAQKKHKILLIDVYTAWCGWCKVMDKETYAKPEIIALIKKHFIPVKFNPEIKDVMYTYNGKQYNGRELSGVISNNQITGYPSTLFIDTKTNKVSIVAGYQNPVEFKTTLEQFITQK